MNSPVAITCKPTTWFTFRAGVILAMFGVFSVLFYMDGSTGYRKKNEAFYLRHTFKEASDDFSRLNGSSKLTPAEWTTFAATKSVLFPEDPTILPSSVRPPVPWPTPLHDFEQMKSLQWNDLWLQYSKEAGLTSNPPEEPYDARKIDEQWVVFWICLALAAAALFTLLRTLRRSISANEEGITSQQGRFTPYSALKTLDLRKWDTKGLAFINYDGPHGRGRIRLDGLTYGGFKKEQNEPAEQLMNLIRSHFSGEILEYAPPTATPEISTSPAEPPQ